MEKNILPHQYHPGTADLHVPLQFDPAVPGYDYSDVLRDVRNNKEQHAVYLLRGLGLDVQPFNQPQTEKGSLRAYDRLQAQFKHFENRKQERLYLRHFTLVKVPNYFSQLVIQTAAHHPVPDTLLVTSKLMLFHRLQMSLNNPSTGYRLTVVMDAGDRLLRHFGRFNHVRSHSDLESLYLCIEGSPDEVVSRFSPFLLNFTLDIYSVAAMEIYRGGMYYFNESGEVEYPRGYPFADKHHHFTRVGEKILAHYRRAKLTLLTEPRTLFLNEDDAAV